MAHSPARLWRSTASLAVAFALHGAVVAALPDAAAAPPEVATTQVWFDVGTPATPSMLAGDEARASDNHPTQSPREVAAARKSPRALNPRRDTRCQRTGSAARVAETPVERELTQGLEDAPGTVLGGEPSTRDGLRASALAAHGMGAGPSPANAVGLAGGPLGPDAAHGPVLVPAQGRCARYFPSGARAAHGEVDVDVSVDANGQASTSAILAERPLGQGFAAAARGCVQALHFAPAMNRAGVSVPGHAKLRLRFDRPQPGRAS